MTEVFRAKMAAKGTQTYYSVTRHNCMDEVFYHITTMEFHTKIVLK